MTTLKRGGKMVHSPEPAQMAASGVQYLRNGEKDVEDRLRTSLNGGELVRSTFASVQ